MNPFVQTEESRHKPLPIETPVDAWRAFVGHRPPRILVALTGVLLGLRIRSGDLWLWDLAVVAGLVLLHPFVEWVIHVYLLHLKPFRLGGREHEVRVARYHRYHHRDPWDLRWVFMPMPDAAVGLAIQMSLIALVLPTWPLRLTGMVTVAALGLLYEWVHFLVHTTYRPRTGWYRRVWRYHRLHHFKNERYWNGVSMHLADLVLGTMPDKDSVPTSPTARNLGVNDDLGEGTGTE